MTIDVGGERPAPGKLQAIERGAIALQVEELKVIYARDFTADVRRLTGDHSYSDDRGSGVVAARTIRTSDDDQMVIVANGQVLDTQPDDVIERLIAHECGHVLIGRRGEEIDWKFATDRVPDWWRRVLVYIASTAVDEFRAETAVYAARYPFERGQSLEGVADLLGEVNGEVLAAILDPACSDNPSLLRDRLLTCLDRATKVIACLAARHLHHSAFDPAALADPAGVMWAEFLAPTWNLYVTTMGEAPSATECWPRESALQLATKVSEVIERFLADLGFHSEGPAGAYFWVDLDEETVRRRAQMLPT